MSKWYYSIDSKVEGPLSEEELKHKITSGLIRTTDLVWKKGMNTWKPAKQYFHDSFTEITSSQYQEPIEKCSSITDYFLYHYITLIVVMLVAFGVFYYVHNYFLDYKNGFYYIVIWGAPLVITIVSGGILVYRMWNEGIKRDLETQGVNSGGLKLFALFLGIVLFIGAFGFLAEARSGYELSKVRSAYSDFTIEVDAPNNMINITGNIGPGFAKQLRNALNLYAGIDTIYINSSGGLVDQALEAAMLIEQYPNMTTVAYNQCDSACVAILMAGYERYADWDMVIGFHASSPILQRDVPVDDDYQRSIECDNYLLSRGVPADIIETASKKQGREVENIPAIDLVDRGVLTGLLDEGYLVEPDYAKWAIVEYVIASLEGEANLFHSPMLPAIRTALPEVVENYAADFYELYKDEEWEQLYESVEIIISEIFSQSILSADSQALYDFYAVVNKQIVYLKDLEQWDTCAMYFGEYSGEEHDKVFSMFSNSLLEEETEARINLIYSANNKNWHPQPLPSWVKKRLEAVLLSTNDQLLRQAFIKADEKYDSRASCQYYYTILSTFLKEEPSTAAPLLRQFYKDRNITD